MTTLTIAHNIFLDREKRYKVHNGETVQEVGVSLPVWWRSATTSEPGIEVFCNYTIRRVADILSIKAIGDGYIVNLPEPDVYKSLSDEMWRSLTPAQQEIWYKNHEPAPSVIDLLDVKDGGREWLAFRQLQNINRQKRTLEVVHFVEIKKIEELLSSLT